MFGSYVQLPEIVSFHARNTTVVCIINQSLRVEIRTFGAIEK